MTLRFVDETTTLDSYEVVCLIHAPARRRTTYHTCSALSAKMFSHRFVISHKLQFLISYSKFSVLFFPLQTDSLILLQNEAVTGKFGDDVGPEFRVTVTRCRKNCI